MYISIFYDFFSLFIFTFIINDWEIELAMHITSQNTVCPPVKLPRCQVFNLFLVLWANNKYLAGPKGQHMILCIHGIICWPLGLARYFLLVQRASKRLRTWNLKSLTGRHCKLEYMLGSRGMWNPISMPDHLLETMDFFISY